MAAPDAFGRIPGVLNTCTHFESVVSRAGQVKQIHNCLMQGMKRKYFIYHEHMHTTCKFVLLISMQTPRLNKIVYFILTRVRHLPPCACTQN